MLLGAGALRDEPVRVMLWRTHDEVSPRPSPEEEDTVLTSWRSNMLARSCTEHRPHPHSTTAGWYSPHAHTRTHTLTRTRGKKTRWVTYDRRISLIRRVSCCPWHQLFSGCSGTVWEQGAGARTLKSHPQHQRVQRRRAAVSMATAKGPPNCCITSFCSLLFWFFTTVTIIILLLILLLIIIII